MTLEVEVVGAGPLPDAEVRRLVAATLNHVGIEDGHVAIAFVDAERIADLNVEHRGEAGPTDVLSFPVDGAEPVDGPRELGDVVICPAYTTDLREAVVHGALHLVGFDHETDDGEMFAAQAEILAQRL